MAVDTGDCGAGGHGACDGGSGGGGGCGEAVAALGCYVVSTLVVRT